ncbi:MAG: bifunctional 3-hydroxydecanoyl-ACP dehydratase/trans-2-decenoyl-ACP isomerase [Proteobacteria bacterium]|nr:bifunctional 3-hydroxydecanoyl-ACP dehydratase/trans-2-decenoyl-ACP isomerase [Pseudomonadota bacterium]
MKYTDFVNQTEFNKEDLIAFSYGRLICDPPDGFEAKLPSPPFLMVDKILSMQKSGHRGKMTAELNIRMDAWYFQCHFPGDPVQPGCLGLDAIWQLLGFYSVWRGGLGSGRALGCDSVSFNGQIRPFNQVARFEIDVIRYSELKNSGSYLAIGNGSVDIDGENVITVKNARVGLFRDISYSDYPLRSVNSIGGIIQRSA